MSPETLILSVCLAVAFGGVPLATLVHAHIAITRAARHVAEIEALAAPEPQHAEDMSCLGVRELQARVLAAAEDFRDRSDDGARRDFRPRADRLRHQYRPPPLANAG